MDQYLTKAANGGKRESSTPKIISPSTKKQIIREAVQVPDLESIDGYVFLSSESRANAISGTIAVAERIHMLISELNGGKPKDGNIQIEMLTQISFKVTYKNLVLECTRDPKSDTRLAIQKASLK
jgi:actin-like ATPase involved in cell morphogenesis